MNMALAQDSNQQPWAGADKQSKGFLVHWLARLFLQLRLQAKAGLQY